MAKIQFDQTHIFLYGTAWALLWGAIGMFVGYYANLRRDFRIHRADFRQFLGQWFQEIYRVSGGDMLKTWDAYLNREREFMGHVIKLQKGYWRRRRFIELCHPLSQLHYADLQSDQHEDCRDVIAEPIKNLIIWV